MALALLATAGGTALGQDEAWREFKGRIVFSDVLIAPQFGSEQAMAAALHRFGRPAIQGSDGFWRFHFVAFLDPVPDVDGVRVVATDVTDPKGKHDVVKVFEVTLQPGQRTVQMNDFVLTDAMGFEHGHSYQLAVTSVADEATAAPHGRGKEDVYARGVVTLR